MPRLGPEQGHDHHPAEPDGSGIAPGQQVPASIGHPQATDWEPGLIGSTGILKYVDFYINGVPQTNPDK
jgi:hypothetical protein